MLRFNSIAGAVLVEQLVHQNPKFYTPGNDIRYMETDLEVLRLETTECVLQQNYEESSELQERTKANF